MNVDEQAVFWSRFVDKVNRSDVAAYGIQDYWGFNGYVSLRNFLATSGAPKCTKTILPGIELRIEAPANFRLNFHILFSENVDPEKLGGLPFAMKLSGLGDLPAAPVYIMEWARKLDDGKLRHHGFRPEERSDPRRMLELGYRTVTVTWPSLIAALRTFQREEYIVILPYDTSDGLSKIDWKKQPHFDTAMFRFADFFECRNRENVDLFLGNRTGGNDSCFDAFLQCLGGQPKPVLSGSDAHRVADYGKFPSGRATWIKADPTFEGLRQCLADPKSRVFIGARPPKLDAIRDYPGRHIDRIRIAKKAETVFAEHWFEAEVPLNPGMIAIIGNKGSGKSALADIIALSANAHCGHYEFLNDRRFRRPPNRSSHFEAEICWCDESAFTKGLHESNDPGKPERVKYLPQSYMEELCNELLGDKESQFEREIRKVIFQHIPVEDRLGAPDLDSLIVKRIQPIQTKIAELRSELSSVNSDFCTLEALTRPVTISRLEQELALRTAELESHERIQPVPPPPLEVDVSPELLQELAQLERDRDALDFQAKGLRVRLTAIAKERQAESNVRAILQSIEEHVGKQKAQAVRAASEGAIPLDVESLVRLSVSYPTLDHLRGTLISEEEEVRKGLALANDESVVARGAKIKGEISQMREQLEGPARLVQAHAEELRKWHDLRRSIIGEQGVPGTIKELETQIEKIKVEYPEQLRQLEGRRMLLAERIYSAVCEHSELLSSLFTHLDGHLMKKFDIECVVYLSCRRLESQFFVYVGHQRGSFAGIDEGKEVFASLVRKHDCETWEGLRQMLDDIMTSLATNGRGASFHVDEQLRRGASAEKFYDFLYGLNYLEPVLTLRLSGRDLSALSPGERGALLLVFYLLVDQSRCPIIIDQPEQNLDNESVFRILVPCFKAAREQRQVIVVTHNPNLAVVCDAEQIVHCSIDKDVGFRVHYRAGAIEDPELNRYLIDVLEGTWPAFRMRDQKYQSNDRRGEDGTER